MIADMSQADAQATGSPDLEQHLRHVPRLVRSHDVNHRVFGTSQLNRINGRIAVGATSALSSMWFFWFCVLLDLAELPAVIAAASPVVIVSYISQTVIQLLALPLLGAGQRIIAAAQDARAEADHETLTALHAINVQQIEILRRLDRAGIR
jgi:hypothetical protein